jgi:deoxyribodipyrimidine photo-lyase
MKSPLVIYWSRRDFRLRDNPALTAAIKLSRETNSPLLPIFILEDYMTSGDYEFQFGYPSRLFLSKALPVFLDNFRYSALVTGKAVEALSKIALKYSVTIFVNEDIYPDFYKQIKKLKQQNIQINICRDQLTIPKDTRTGKGDIYSVFTPFKKAVWVSFLETPEIKAPSLADVDFFNPESLSKEIRSIKCNEKNILNKFSTKRQIKIDDYILDIDDLLDFKTNIDDWYFSEKQALAHFKYYLEHHLTDYKNDRDSLEKDLTSKMSLALAWGLVSARILTALMKNYFNDSFSNPFSTRSNQGGIHFISELIWREFYKYLLYHHPELMHKEFQSKFRGTIDWESNVVAKKRFIAWIKGETGYPVVDAAMMQLAKTGWMHNRARMIVASILTKNLGVDWRWGQEYFRAMLIDLDESSNNGGWQWGASVGADPKPIRIFNPYLQAENYDKSGNYQKKWLSEDRLNNPIEPIVDHRLARNQALERYKLDEKKHGKPRDY